MRDSKPALAHFRGEGLRRGLVCTAAVASHHCPDNLSHSNIQVGWYCQKGLEFMSIIDMRELESTTKRLINRDKQRDNSGIVHTFNDCVDT